MVLVFQKFFIRLSEYRTFSIRNLSKINHFSIRIRASTANNPRSVATRGLMSISLISGCKTEQCGQADYDIRILLSSTPRWPRVPFIIG